MADRPNILVILTDQLRPFELGCYGHRLVETPNIDRLAAEGVRFETACTPNPLCTPARSALLSGQYSRTCTGMLGCSGEPASVRYQFPNTTLAERLELGFVGPSGSHTGYETALIGKWHIGVHPRLLGFSQTIYPRVYHKNADQTYFDGVGRSWLQDGYCPPFEIATTDAFVRKERSQPWFAYHNICLPHMPYFDVPDRFRRRYKPEEILPRDNVYRDGAMYHDEHAFLVYLYDHLYYAEHREEYSRLPDGYDLRKLYADYCGMIAAVDEQVGDLIRMLDESGQRENTVVVFTSDHGDNLGSHHLWNKHAVYDESIRVPLIISWPGTIQPAVATDHVASLVDIAPTVLSLTGCTPPAEMQGRDLSPILRGEAKTVGDGCAFAENVVGEIAVRTPTHLYAMMTEVRSGAPDRLIADDAFMYFDMRIDPYQMINLAKTTGSPEVDPIAADLRARLTAWNTATPWMSGSLGGTYGQGA